MTSNVPRTKFRIWLQPGVKRIPSGWGNARNVRSEWPGPDCVDVAVDGDGSDLEAYLRSRPKLFGFWDRIPEDTA